MKAEMGGIRAMLHGYINAFVRRVHAQLTIFEEPDLVGMRGKVSTLYTKVCSLTERHV